MLYVDSVSNVAQGIYFIQSFSNEKFMKRISLY